MLPSELLAKWADGILLAYCKIQNRRRNSIFESQRINCPFSAFHMSLAWVKETENTKIICW